MSAKWLLGIIVPVLFLACSALGQVNELSVTAGRTFVSTQTILNDPLSTNPHIHFGNEETIAFNYARLLKGGKFLGFHAELPVVIYPRMDLNTGLNQIPKDIGALFVTPSFRMNLFSGDSVTPWVSAGGGYGRFRYAKEANYGYGTYIGPGGSNTGVVQFGAGLDVWVWHHWGFRVEARDFYSGNPYLNAIAGEPINTSNSRQHNYYVGAGIAHRF